MKHIITTTFRQLKENEACVDSYKKLAKNLGGIKKYGKDTPITFEQIYNSNDYEDTLWALRVVDDKYYLLWRHFAVDCAKQVEHLMEDERSISALVVARNYANGLTTNAELSSASASASASARDSDSSCVSSCASASASAWASAKDFDASCASSCAAASASASASAWASARDFDASSCAADSAWASAMAAKIKLLLIYCKTGKRPDNSVKLLKSFMEEASHE